MMKKHTRRIWLESTAGLALAGFVRGVETNSICPLSFGTYGLPGYTLADAIRLVAETGFDAIEIAAMPGYHGAPDQLSTVQRAEIRSHLSGSGLQLGALMGLPRPDTKKTAKNTEWVEQLLELATALSPGNPPMIQSVLGGGKWEEKKALYRDCLGPWVKLASEAGVKLGIKPHRGHAMSRPDQAIWLIEQLDAAGTLSLVYDYSHYAFRDMSVEDTVKTALPHTGYLVMKDAVQTGDKVRFALPGETGKMPHARILRLFHEGGYCGEICCEVSSQVWKQEGYDPRQAAATCCRNLTRIYSKAGVPRS